VTRRGACTFCGIVRGETSAAVVYTDEEVMAFLDRAPLLPGHTLIVPRVHHETLDDAPDALVAPLFTVVRQVSRAQQQALGADGSYTAINTRVSQSVPHLHVHVVPRRSKDGLFRAGMVWARRPYGAGEAEEIAARLRSALGQVSG
jgi:histidine triad (HIT) family protein